ncbi:peptidoglycan recognition protein [Streptomyces sp. ISL-12]|uniref:peptidoglycan recognition protein family protein n=1 Tax=Streptomyces sp. ISL-12 TaxID=2819177 RepID=UPI001BE5C674|nr:peptidoglycan recognition protein [Streptomyces sp. ISL-12]MBT2409661.1 peptidoglycan recognition protein [Streptomyces sp. ISL-12]
MHGFLASSIGVTCAAALALPLVPPAAAGTPAPASASAAARAARAEASVSGSTQSLPLRALAQDRSADPSGPAGAVEQGVPRRDVRPFSLVGVVWDDPDRELHGSVRVRVRDAATGAWSGWQDLATHNADHGADPGTPERASDRVRGATAPLWVGASDGVELRVRADDDWEFAFPEGLRLELVDPGGEEEGGTSEYSPLAADQAAPAKAKPYVGPRPAIVTRRGWGADEGLREKGFKYTKKVKAAFVHHSATGNNYTCAQAPSVIRSIYRYHVKSMGWRDIGYNFLVDKCGKIYEGRAGGVAKPVLGAHTLGFNSDSMGIAVLGTYSTKKPSAAAVRGVARLSAWKLGLYGMNPRGKTYLKSGGGNLYRKGKNVRLSVISGHRDGFNTSCPGAQLYKKLGTARSTAAKYQGR